MSGRPCPYCTRPMADSQSGASTAATRDHIVPATRGGITKITVCTRCNHEKADRTLTEWSKFLRETYDDRAFVVDAFLRSRPDILQLEESKMLGAEQLSGSACRSTTDRLILTSRGYAGHANADSEASLRRRATGLPFTKRLMLAS